MTDTPPAGPAEEQQYWDGRYAESHRMWSGRPNVVLVREVADLAPGRALDLGCGEGADAVWLAAQGWRVTAVDVSEVALSRAAEHAADAGVAAAIVFEHANLSEAFPAGPFDLVSAQFFYPRGGTPREELLRRAAAAVAPGGVLLIEGHGGPPPWEQAGNHAAAGQGADQHLGHAHSHDGVQFPTAEEVLASLKLAEGEWELLLCEEHERVQNGPDGKPAARCDNTLKLRRRPAPGPASDR